MTTQEVPTINLRESRTFDGVLRATFVFIRTMFKPLLRSIVLVAGIPTLVTFLLTLIAVLTTQSTDGINIRSTFIFVEFSFGASFTLIAAVAWFIPYVFVHVSITVFIVLYVGNGYQPPTPADVWIGTKNNLLRLTGTFVFATLSIIFSFLFFLIPGIYVSIAFWIVFTVQLQEGRTFFDAVNRCFELIKGWWWQTCGILFICQVCFLSISYIAIHSHILLNVLSAAGIGGMPYSAISALLASLSLVIILLASFPLSIAPAIQYYNLVERKEARGLHERISEIEETLSDTPPNSASAL